MKRRRVAIGIAGALAILASGCSATPPSRFYVLSAVAPPAVGSSDMSVSVGPVSVPAAVDRPQMVITVSPNRVQLDEFHRWASPLASNIARVVAQDLAAALGSPRVVATPQTLTADADYRVAIDVQTFDSTPGEAAVLEAVWTVIRSKDARSRIGRTTVREAVSAKDYDALAAAHSRALARLSQDIADAVRSLAVQ